MTEIQGKVSKIQILKRDEYNQALSDIYFQDQHDKNISGIILSNNGSK
jgi:hypothetical protein